MGQDYDRSHSHPDDDLRRHDEPIDKDQDRASTAAHPHREDETLREMRTTPIQSPQDDWMDESGHGTNPYPEYPDSTDEDVAQGPEDAVELREQDQSTIPQQMPMQNMGSFAGQLHPGLVVTSAEGETVGEIKEILENDFLVELSNGTSIYIPFTALRAVSSRRAALEISADQVDRQDWARPPSGRRPSAELHP